MNQALEIYRVKGILGLLDDKRRGTQDKVDRPSNYRQF